MSDRLDYELADYILQLDDDTFSQPPETEIVSKAGAPMDDTIRGHPCKDHDWVPLAPFATPQKWHIRRSIVDTNLD